MDGQKCDSNSAVQRRPLKKFQRCRRRIVMCIRAVCRAALHISYLAQKYVGLVAYVGLLGLQLLSNRLLYTLMTSPFQIYDLLLPSRLCS